MIELTAKFDCIGLFKNREGEMQEAKTAHYVIGKIGDLISGGLYIPKDAVFPKEGILIKLKENHNA